MEPLDYGMIAMMVLWAFGMVILILNIFDKGPPE